MNSHEERQGMKKNYGETKTGPLVGAAICTHCDVSAGVCPPRKLSSFHVSRSSFLFSLVVPSQRTPGCRLLRLAAGMRRNSAEATSDEINFI